MSDDDLTTVTTVTDAMRAEMIVGYLREHGLRAFAVGAQHNALLGPLNGAYIQIPLRVPKSQLEEARALLEAFESEEDDAEPPADEPEAEPALDEPDPRTIEEDRRAGRVASEPSSGRHAATPLDDPPRRPYVAAFLAFLVVPGLGHVYVREYVSAGLIAFTAAVLFVLNIDVPYEYRGVVGIMFLSLYIIDAIDAARGAARRNRGVARSAFAQLVTIGLLLGAALCVGLVWNEVTRTLAPEPDPLPYGLEGDDFAPRRNPGGGPFQIDHVR